MSAKLGLNLSPSKAKVAHARKHFETLKRETDRVFKEIEPYAVTWGKIDQQTGWVPIKLIQQHITDYTLGCYVGDVIHNLRAALDYITAALATACGAEIRYQQFPIFHKQPTYDATFGTPQAPKVQSRALYGINHSGALECIRKMQPFEGQGNAHAHPLWHIERLSNADKHREIIADASKWGHVHFDFLAGTVVETRNNPAPPNGRTSQSMRSRE